MDEFSDTICALSTPIGRSAISIIRMSGKEAISIISKIFTPREKLKKIKDRKIAHGWIQTPKTNQKIDEVLLFIFRQPSSYTGEDMVEISTHGGTVIPKKVIRLLINNGARMAERGEFTKRSFLNGKMSLLEAEALLDVIQAKTEKGLAIAEENLDGKLQTEIENVKQHFLEIKALIEADLDFSESDNLSLDHQELSRKINTLRERLSKMLASYKSGKILLNGFKIAIVGKPNVGKSSLFNTILQEDKAIVTELPGTTRDLLEGVVDIEGYPVIFHDMAGIRSTESEVEKIGVDRALEMACSSDGILFIMDASTPITDEDKKIFDIISNKPFVPVVNKSDLENKIGGIPFTGKPLYVSAKEHRGIDRLNKAIINLIQEVIPVGFGEDVTCTTERQRNKINNAIDSLKRGNEVLKEKKDLELLAFDIDDAINSLKELTGEITSQNVLDEIFSDFCIGK